MKFFQKWKNLHKNLMMVIVGVLLSIVFMLVMGISAVNNVEKLAQGTTYMLLQQCQSFDNIQSVNRVRTLFAMHENLTSLNSTFVRDPSMVNNEFLEEYVDGMQLSGVAVLDGDLKLVASAYTPQPVKENWKEDFYPGLFEKMLDAPTQVYAQRMTVDGQYYDICATARKDARGVIIAYYKQPMSLIYDTEKDLKQLLKNVHMDSNGEFIILHNGRIISEGSSVADTEGFIKNAANFSNEKLTLTKFEGSHFFGKKVVHGEYEIYLYFPFTVVFRNLCIEVLLFILLYVSFCLTGSLFKSKSERIKQQMLGESNKKLSESSRIMKSLETIYFTIFYVDLQEDTYRALFFAPWIARAIGETGNFSEAARKLIAISVEESDRDALHTHLNFDYVRAQLKKEADKIVPSSYYIDYKVHRYDIIRWCRITLTGVDFDEDGNPLHVLVMLQDVDAEKSKEVAYQEQIIKEADLAQAASRAKSTFLFNVSHDIRTPMNAILGYSNLAKKTLDDPARLSRYLENIQISGERMLSLINEVLELARIENGKTVIKNDAAQVGVGIRSCIIIATPAAKEKDITIGLDMEIEYPYVYVDHPHMSRIVLNLLNNAIKFTNNGGHIQCSVRQLPCDIPMHCLTEVRIRDNGIGISKEFLPHIFEMFERERNSTVSGVAGTGLGLGIAKKFAELMNGSIEAESEEGKGSTFTIRIPHRLASEEDVKAGAVRYRVNKASVSGKRILMAEDGDMNAEILTEIIQEEGIEIERAKDGEECLKMLENAPKNYYHLILMDIQMPNIDGFVATKRIRQSADKDKANIPIIAMTANAFPEDKEQSIQAGMNAHLSKPIDAKELMLVFEKYLDAELILFNDKQNGGGYKYC